MSRLNNASAPDTPARDAHSVNSESEGYIAFFTRTTRSFITSPIQYVFGSNNSAQPNAITPPSIGVAAPAPAVASAARSAPTAVFSPAPHEMNAIAPVAAVSAPPAVSMRVPASAGAPVSELGGEIAMVFDQPAQVGVVGNRVAVGSVSTDRPPVVPNSLLSPVVPASAAGTASPSAIADAFAISGDVRTAQPRRWTIRGDHQQSWHDVSAAAYRQDRHDAHAPYPFSPQVFNMFEEAASESKEEDLPDDSDDITEVYTDHFTPAAGNTDSVGWTPVSYGRRASVGALNQGGGSRTLASTATTLPPLVPTSTSSSSTATTSTTALRASVRHEAFGNTLSFLSEVDAALNASTLAVAHGLDSSLECILPKTDRAAKGTEAYAYEQEKITKCVFKASDKLGVAEFEVTIAEAGNFSDDTAIPDTLYRINESMQIMNVHAERYDLTSCSRIAHLAPGALSNTDFTASTMPPAVAFDVTKPLLKLVDNWGIVTIGWVKFVQVYINSSPYIVQEDRDSSRLFFHFIRNCLTKDLLDKTDRQFKKYFVGPEQGGMSYFWVMLRTIHTGGAAIVPTLQAVFKAFSVEGPLNVPGQNFVVIGKKFKPIINQLRLLHGLTDEMPLQLQQGAQLTTVEQFRDVFRPVAHETMLGTTAPTLDEPLNRVAAANQDELALRLQGMLDKFVDVYLRMHALNQWDASSKARRGKGKGFFPSIGRGLSQIICDNCGETGHTLYKCPKDLDEEKINAARKKRGCTVDWKTKVNQESTAFRRNYDRRNGGADDSGKKTFPQRGTNGQIEKFPAYKIEGTDLKLKCTKCKPQWGNHQTRDHKASLGNPNFDHASAHPTCPLAEVSRALAASASNASEVKRLKEEAAKFKKSDDALWDTAQSKGRTSVEGVAAIATIEKNRKAFFADFR